MTCAKGTTRHVISKHEKIIDPFYAREDLFECQDGPVSRSNNANQIRFELDTLKLTARVLAD